MLKPFRQQHELAGSANRRNASSTPIRGRPQGDNTRRRKLSPTPPENRPRTPGDEKDCPKTKNKNKRICVAKTDKPDDDKKREATIDQKHAAIVVSDNEDNDVCLAAVKVEVKAEKGTVMGFEREKRYGLVHSMSFTKRL